MPIDFSKYKKKDALEPEHIPEQDIKKIADKNRNRNDFKTEPKEDIIEDEIVSNIGLVDYGNLNASAKLNYIKFSYAMLTNKSTTNKSKAYMKKVVLSILKTF